jgi:hypothetical protein
LGDAGERRGLVCFVIQRFPIAGKGCKSARESMQRIPEIGGGRSGGLCGVLLRSLN